MLLEFLRHHMLFMCSANSTVFFEWKWPDSILLLFKLFVQFIILSNITKWATFFALQTHRLPRSFFLVCHTNFPFVYVRQMRSIQNLSSFYQHILIPYWAETGIRTLDPLFTKQVLCRWAIPALPLTLIFLCQVKDSNLRRRTPTDLQSVPVDRLGNLA